MSTSGSKPPSLPPLPTNLDPQLRNYLKAVDTHLKVKAGDTGNPKDRNLTLRDLEESGIVSSPNTVKDFSITAGDPTVKLVSPDQLITDQVGEENTSKKFSKTGIILASEFADELAISTPTNMEDASTLLGLYIGGLSTGAQWINNHTRGDIPYGGGAGIELANTSANIDATFDFTTGVHSRGGKKPYLITVTANKLGFAHENPSTSSSSGTWTQAIDPYWAETVVLLIHADDIDAIAGSGNHGGSMENYNDGNNSNTALRAAEGEKQISALLQYDHNVMQPLIIRFVSNLRSETKYRLDLGAAVLGVDQAKYKNLQFTVQGLTT
tara:strand:+ start:6179 stop:7153 length:975 start_codon:yes stop_codon:yes gene_type:complete